MCGREDLMLAAKEVSLYDGYNRGVLKYRFFFNIKFLRKITSPWGKSQWDSRGC